MARKDYDLCMSCLHTENIHVSEGTGCGAWKCPCVKFISKMRAA